MATNIPPHNLGELCDAVVALVDDPELSDEVRLCINTNIYVLLVWINISILL